MVDPVTTGQLVLLGVAALAASTVAATTGTGGGVLLLPVMVALFGVRDAVPMYAVANLIGNLSRVWLNWPEVRLQVVRWFALGAVPMAVLGALLFARAPESWLTRALGVFLLAMVLWRRLRTEDAPGFPVRRFALIGGVFAFVSALLGSAGPFLAPFFLAFGLVKGAYIGTEALATALMHVAKLFTYGSAGVLSRTAVVVGVALGPLMFAGAWLGRRAVSRLSPRGFVRLIDAVLVVFGLWFLARG